MKLIGFTNKFYTLWDVTSTTNYTTINGQHRVSGISTHYTYYQNLSMDEQSAKLKFTKLTGKEAPEVDENLRGKNNSFRINESKCPYLKTEFNKGKYIGNIIEDCDDIDYLKWAYSNMLDSDRKPYAVKAFLKNGLVENLWKDGYCTPDELKKQKQDKKDYDFYNSLVGGFHFNNGEKIELDVTVYSIGGINGTYGWTNIYIFLFDNNKKIKYSGSKKYDIKEGQKIKIKGTVKHNSYYSDRMDDQISETKILRMKIIG